VHLVQQAGAGAARDPGGRMSSGYVLDAITASGLTVRVSCSPAACSRHRNVAILRTRAAPLPRYGGAASQT
jgi:hypothetical protein